MTRAKAKQKPTTKLIPWDKVREAWESEPGATYSSVATLFNVSKQRVGKKAKEGKGWKKINDKGPGFKQRVNTKADETAATAVGEVLPPQNESAPLGVPSPASIDAGITARAQVIDRHRREWQIPRNRLYAAMQEITDRVKAFAMMKEAKIMSETLLNIHKGERVSWGLDGEPTLIVKHVIPPSPRDIYD